MEPGCNTKTIAYENRTFLVNMLNFENGMIVSISENSLKIKNHNQRGKRDMLSAQFISQRTGNSKSILPLSITG